MPFENREEERESSNKGTGSKGGSALVVRE